jgi:5S rRNA maturation endonuclease (ribonuclease M5)
MNKKLEPEDIRKVLQELEGNILIVEGRKDESALKGLGLRNIVKISSRPLLETAQDAVFLAEKHKNRQVIILTDFDRTGSRLASRLRLLLQSRKIHANSRIRRGVMNLGIKCIEEMASLPGMPDSAEGRISRSAAVSGISKLTERDAYVKTCTYFNKVRDKGLHKGKRYNRKTRRDRGDIRAD